MVLGVQRRWRALQERSPLMSENAFIFFFAPNRIDFEWGADELISTARTRCLDLALFGLNSYPAVFDLAAVAFYADGAGGGDFEFGF
jgi:hypothetical protein